MSKTLTKQQRIKRTERRRVLIALRYLFPILSAILTAVTCFIPCLRYTTSEGTNAPISLVELMSNTWSNVRFYLFSGNETEAHTETFSWVVLAMLVVFSLLFLLGTAAAVFCALGARWYGRDPDDRSDKRILFLTLVPNRIVACIYEAMILPLLLFPRLLVLCYEEIIHVNVLLNLTFAEPLVFGLILYVLTVVLTVLSAGWERAEGLDPHKKPRVAQPAREEEPDDVEEEVPIFKTDAERIAYEMTLRSREEQTERLRKLLNKEDRDE